MIQFNYYKYLFN